MVFVIDGSKSIRESEGTSDLDNWFQILNFIRIGISHWPGDGVRVGPNNALIGVVVFGNDAVVQMQFGEHDNFDDFAVSSKLNISSLPEGVSATLESGRYVLSYSRGRFDLVKYSILRIFYQTEIMNGWGFCQVKKNQKIREKLGSGWVGQAPTRIFFLKFCRFVSFCVVFMFPNVSKKKTWQDPLKR